MGQTEMSKRELARVEVLARVRSKQLRVVDAGRLMQVSYRQAKRRFVHGTCTLEGATTVVMLPFHCEAYFVGRSTDKER